MGSGSPEITLTMNIRGGETLEYEVTTDNRYVLQQGFFEDFPAEISVSATGTGCALYTVSGHQVVKPIIQNIQDQNWNFWKFLFLFEKKIKPNMCFSILCLLLCLGYST